jgi:gas vesicle protein
MNSDNSNTSEEFVNRTLARLQKTYRLTLTVTIVILAAEGIYLTWLNNKLADVLEVVQITVDNHRDDFNSAKELVNKIPAKSEYADKIAKLDNALDTITKAKNAEGVAELISSRIVDELNWQRDVIASNARDYLRKELEQLPLRINKLIPEYSGRLSHEVDNWIRNYCTATSDELGTTFDTFLDQHSEDIRKFSEATDDEEALARLDKELTIQWVHFMENTPLDKYGTLKDQSDRMLRRIKAANELLRPLVIKNTEDLTPEERRLRRAVGLLMDRVQHLPTKSGSTE